MIRRCFRLIEADAYAWSILFFIWGPEVEFSASISVTDKMETNRLGSEISGRGLESTKICCHGLGKTVGEKIFERADKGAIKRCPTLTIKPFRAVAVICSVMSRVWRPFTKWLTVGLNEVDAASDRWGQRT